MAHAEASARSVDAAVTAAAAQLGLRSDQVDFEILEEPTASTFGYIGTPARVRVTPRAAAGSGGGSEGTGTEVVEGGSERLHAGNGPATGGSEPVFAGAEPPGPDHPIAQEPATQANVSNEAGAPDGSGSASASATAPAQAPASETGNGQVTTDRQPQAAAQAAGEGDAPPGTSAAPARSAVPVGSDASSSSSPALSVPADETTADEGGGSGPRPTRSSRRTYKDEPIEPQMVEEDTERAGDFLEGLLDALDVDGDITTWVDEVGGHIDLEGADLDVLVGSNGETLDSLQELTRLAVLRQSKRRVRLLIDINGFRARQREQLTAMVQAKVEQVIRTREDHEFQPMTPAERKVVHDAVAAMEGVRTESLGEEPNRRVVIRPT